MEPLEVKKPKESKRVYEAIILQLDPIKKKEVIEKFWAKVNKGSSKECWTWKGSVHSNTGYGLFVYPRTVSIGAHRLSWVIHYDSPIPKKLFVCHSCDVKRCINPEHLFLATPRINIQDMILKKRNNFSKGRFKIFKNSLESKTKMIIEALEGKQSYHKIAISFGQTKWSPLTQLRRLFNDIKDRSFLPDHLQKLYASCKSWQEAKLIRAECVKRERKNNSSVQKTGAL